MKYVRKFNEGTKERSTIEDWCIKFRLGNYTINEDNTVDVDNSCAIQDINTNKFPIKFGTINGYFDCRYNNLTSLNKSPSIIKGSFMCGENKLTNLIGGPIEVGGSYNCEYNQLISLEGYPEKIERSFFCEHNPIWEIYRLFNYDYKAYKDSLDYNYLKGTNIIKLRFKEALEEAGIEMPKSIEGYKYI